MSKLIGIAGGSCSGKTTLARKLHQELGEEHCHVIYQDSFYIDQSDRFDFDGGSVNFDHPEALDFFLMSQVLEKLKSGDSVEIPIYDFSTHKRKPEVEFLSPKSVILVDGTLILSQDFLRALFDHSCFIECDYATRLERRLARDVRERGRSQAGVLDQFASQVEPMHQAFVEPSKTHADCIFNQESLQAPGFLQNLKTEWWL